MEKKIQKAYLVGTVVVILGGIWCVTTFVIHMLDLLKNTNSDISVAVITGAITLIITVLSVTLGKAYEVRTLIIKENRDKKIPIYEDLIKFLFNKVLMGAKTGNEVTEGEMVEFMSDFTQRIMIWGSDDVLNSFVRIRQIAFDEEETKKNPLSIMLGYEDLIKEIRKDLGYKNKGFKKGDLLSLFINDLNKYLSRNS